MALTGVRSTQDLVIMAGWDAAKLKAYELADGTPYAAVAAEVGAALTALSAELANDPLWASLVSFTDRPETKYRVGASSSMNAFTEHGKGDANRAERQGHMIPLQAFDEIVGWTWTYLKNANMDDVRADIRNAIDAIRNRWRIQILTRLFKRGDDTGDIKGLGSGYSPGFATAAASTAVDYTPPQFAGNTFDSDHEHYVGIAGGAFTNAVFADAETELMEHGLVGPFDFMIGEADKATVEALTDFVPVASSIVAYGNSQDLANLPTLSGGQSYYIGTIGQFKIRVVPGVPQYYGFGWKSYGLNDPMNPLVIRLEKGTAMPQPVLMTDPRAGNGTLPMQNMMLYVEFGVGVKHRANGTARYTNSTTWADATVS